MLQRGRYILLQDERSVSDYKMEEQCVAVKFEKSQFDENGEFVLARSGILGSCPRPAMLASVVGALCL